jgi:methionyl-tRNA formyltransferase
MELNILFMGSSDFSVPILKSLHKARWASAVVTQPNKPTGRGKRIEPPIVKIIAEEMGLPVYQFFKLDHENMEAALDKNDIDLVVVAAYGKILPKWLLNYPKYGAINVHASLLPRWRGAAPIQAAIKFGDKQTGITIIKMDEGLDTGDILSQASANIAQDDTAASLGKKLADLGASSLIETIEGYINKEITPKKQDSENATMTRMINKLDGELDFNQPAEILERKIRAYNPWPICFFHWDSEYLRIYEAEISAQTRLNPSRRGIIDKYPCIGTSTNSLLLKTVQPSGKKIMDGKSFLNGAKDWVKD